MALNLPKGPSRKKKRAPREVAPRYVDQEDWDKFLRWTLACVYVACQRSYDDQPVFPAELLSMCKRRHVAQARRILHKTIFNTVGQRLERRRVLIIVCPGGRPKKLPPISTTNIARMFGGNHSTFVLQRTNEAFQLLSPLPLREVHEAQLLIDEECMKLVRQTAAEEDFGG